MQQVELEDSDQNVSFPNDVAVSRYLVNPASGILFGERMKSDPSTPLSSFLPVERRVQTMQLGQIWGRALG